MMKLIYKLLGKEKQEIVLKDDTETLPKYHDENFAAAFSGMAFYTDNQLKAMQNAAPKNSEIIDI